MALNGNSGHAWHLLVAPFTVSDNMLARIRCIHLNKEGRCLSSQQNSSRVTLIGRE